MLLALSGALSNALRRHFLAFNVSHAPVIVVQGAAPGLLPRAVWNSAPKIDAPVAHAALPEGCAVEPLAVEHLQAAAWKSLLSQTIQVDFMRKRMCSRMKAAFKRGVFFLLEVWLQTLSKFAWVPRAQMKALVWPQAAYLHFGVRAQAPALLSCLLRSRGCGVWVSMHSPAPSFSLTCKHLQAQVGGSVCCLGYTWSRGLDN